MHREFITKHHLPGIGRSLSGVTGDISPQEVVKSNQDLVQVMISEQKREKRSSFNFGEEVVGVSNFIRSLIFFRNISKQLILYLTLSCQRPRNTCSCCNQTMKSKFSERERKSFWKCANMINKKKPDTMKQIPYDVVAEYAFKYERSSFDDKHLKIFEILHTNA
jgi:hypothetical protein